MLEATLDPSHLLELLRGSLSLDEPVVDDFRLADCHRLGEGDPVIVELLRGPQERIVVAVDAIEDDDPHEPAARVAGLGLSYRESVSRELGLEACKLLASLLDRRLGASPRRWVPPSSSRCSLAGPVAAEVTWRRATFDEEGDRSVLERDFDHYARLYGVRPAVAQVVVGEDAAPGVSVHYPAPVGDRVPNSAAIYPISPRITHRRRMRRYFGGLGYAFDEHGQARVVPTPQTYGRALTGRAGLARVRPHMVASRTSSLSPLRWGSIVRRHVLPISVAPRWAVELHRHTRNVRLLENIPCDVGMIVHDMSLHAMALHAVPEAAWDALVRRAVARVRARPWSLLAGRLGMLARLAAFFEGPLTSACWEAWREADEPEDFASCFSARFESLMHALETL
jgi:hypothetical protein